MRKKYDIAVVIGRFSPAHNAHIELFRTALSSAEHVIIIIGGHNSPRSVRNPWTADERIEMIKTCFTVEELNRICFGKISDSLYSDADWVKNVTSTVHSITYGEFKYGFDIPPSICLIGHNKGDTDYLNYFKQYKYIEVKPYEYTDINRDGVISATHARLSYFTDKLTELEDVCPPTVIQYLKDFKNTPAYELVKHEYDEAIKYDAQFANAPYGYTNFVTVDAMVVQSGHVLLVKRKFAPGKGLWALPGGHLNVNETFIDGAIRELKEETSIKVPNKVLYGSIIYDKIFDHPDRSLRCRCNEKIGRTITRLFVFKLNDAEALPLVRSNDDASDVWFFTFDEISKMRALMFEDHWDLVQKGLQSI